MRLRSRVRKPECNVEDLLPAFYQDGHRIDPRPAWRESPDEVLLREESRRMVHEKISRLPEDSRNVLLLRDIQQVSTAEAAEQLDVSEAVIKTRLHRARQALRKLLEEELHTYTNCWLESGQQIPPGTTNFDNPLSRSNQKLINRL